MKPFILIPFYTLFLFSQNIELLNTNNLELNKKILENIKKEVSNVNIKTDNVISNIENLSKNDKLRLGIISNESLIYYQNYKDSNLNDKIKLIVPLYNKFIYLITLKESKINSIKDLNKKNVSIGKKYSSEWFIGNILKKEYNISWKEYNDEINSRDTLINVAKKLKIGKIDAFFYIGIDNNEINLVEKHLQDTIKKFLKVIDIQSKFFNTKNIQKSKHKWIDTKSKKMLFTKELIVVHNFFYIKGETPKINKEYEKTIFDIRKSIAKNIKKNFNINTRDFHGVKWEKWLPGSLVKTSTIVNK